MKVEHIKDQPAGWSRDPNRVYIGRPRMIEGVWNPGYFGNPIVKGQKCQECHLVHVQGGDTLPCYEKWLRQQILKPKAREAVKNLYGKILVCFCKPNPCHGDVLMKVSKELNNE